MPPAPAQTSNIAGPGTGSVIPTVPAGTPGGGAPVAGAVPIGQDSAQRYRALNAAGYATPGTVDPNQQTPNTAKLPSEPTVLTSGNITDTVIPNNNNALASLANKGSYVQDGVTYHADGTLASTTPPAGAIPQGATDNGDGTYTLNGATFASTTDPATASINANIASLKGSLDAGTKAQIDAIEQQYTGLKNAQAMINTQANGARRTALLTGGTSRYSPDTASGIMQSQLSFGLQQIAKLDADENAAIAAAKNAQQTGDAQLMDSAIKDAQDIRQQKSDIAKSLNDALSKAQADALTASKASQQSETIAQLYAQGTHDPAAILKTLTDAGMSVTADDISKVIKDLTPTATSTDVLKYSSSQVSKLLAAGIPATSVQALQDYYNGHGDPAALSGLSSAQQAAVKDAMSGTKAPGTTAAKSYVSGSLKYTDTDLGTTSSWLNATKGPDNYVDPNAYQEAFDAWTNDGGLPKDFLAKFPPKNFINPANDWLPKYLQSKTGTAASTDVASQINALFPSK